MYKETTTATVPEDTLFALSQDIRKASFAMDQLFSNMIPDANLTRTPYGELIATMATNNYFIEIISDYLAAAAQKIAELQTETQQEVTP